MVRSEARRCASFCSEVLGLFRVHIDQDALPEQPDPKAHLFPTIPHSHPWRLGPTSASSLLV